MREWVVCGMIFLLLPCVSSSTYIIEHRSTSVGDVSWPPGFNNSEIALSIGGSMSVSGNITMNGSAVCTVGNGLCAGAPGSGTVTEVDTGTYLTGGPLTTTGTLDVDVGALGLLFYSLSNPNGFLNGTTFTTCTSGNASVWTGSSFGCVNLSSGPSGTNGTSGVNGANGQASNISVVNLGNGSYKLVMTYVPNGTNYLNFTTANLTGETGAPGSNGANGTNGTSITYIAVLGNGSLQINLSNGTNYVSGNLTGPAGASGVGGGGSNITGVAVSNVGTTQTLQINTTGGTSTIWNASWTDQTGGGGSGISQWNVTNGTVRSSVVNATDVTFTAGTGILIGLAGTTLTFTSTATGGGDGNSNVTAFTFTDATGLLQLTQDSGATTIFNATIPRNTTAQVNTVIQANAYAYANSSNGLGISGKATTCGVADSATNGLTTSSAWTGGDLGGTGLAATVNPNIARVANCSAGQFMNGTSAAGTLACGTPTTNADTLDTYHSSNFLNTTGFAAENLTSGTVAVARLPSLNSQHTHDAANITTGTIVNARYNTSFLWTYTGGIPDSNISSAATWTAKAATGQSTLCTAGNHVANFSVTTTGVLVNCTADSVTVPYQNTAAGWSNATGNIVTVDITKNVTIGGSTFFADTLNNRVGVGNTLPNATLHVVGGVIVTGGINLTDNDLNISGVGHCVVLPGGGKVCGNTTAVYLCAPGAC